MYHSSTLSKVLDVSIWSPWWSTRWGRDCAWLSFASPVCWRSSRGRPPWSRRRSPPASSSWRPRTGWPSWWARCRSTGASAGSPMSGRESGSGSNRGCRTCPSLMTCSLSKIGTVLTDGTSKQIFYINISSVKKNATRDYSSLKQCQYEFEYFNKHKMSFSFSRNKIYEMVK